MKKTSMYGLVGLAAAVAGAVGGNRALGNYLYDQLNHPPVRSPEREERYPVQQEGRLWARSMEGFQEASLTATDQVELWGAVRPADRPGEHRWAVCLHGYADTYEAMGAQGLWYHRAGWNVLLPDQRGHGRSGGACIGWGYLERLDILGWINWILRRDPEARIVLHGASMGGATVLMVTGGPVPRQLKAVISDCAYTTFEEEAKHVLKNSGSSLAPDVPVPAPAGLLFSALRKATLRHAAGFDLRDAAPIEAVKQSKTPTLFIHGVADDFVPAPMMGRLYQAAACPKRFLWVPEAGHVAAVGADPDLYWSAVSEFLEEYIH